MSGRHRKDGPAVDEALPTEVPVGQPWGLEATPLPLANLTPVAAAPSPAAVAAPAQAAVAAPAHAPAPAPAPAQAPVARPLPSVPFAAPVGTGSAAEAAPVLPVGSSARRAAREQQRRRSRRSKGLVVGLVAVLAVVAAVGGYKVWRGASAPPAAAASTARPQSTLLLQVVDAQHLTVAAVLLAHDTRGQGTSFGALVPSSLAVDGSGTGAGTFGSLSAGQDAGGPQAGTVLSDLVGVAVDGTWVLDAAGLAALVDNVGGVDVNVDRDVTVTVPGGVQTLASAGQQHLTGAVAATYATYLAAGEPEQARLARFATVLGALLPKLPADTTARAALLNGLGTHSSTTVKPSVLDTFLGGLRSDAAGNRIGFDTVPTHSLDLGSGTPTLVIDPAGTATLVKTNFSGSLPAQRPGGPISVVIQNGVGTPGLSAKARTKLVAAGITYVGGGNASRFGYPKSIVLVPTSAGSDGQKKGQAVAKALGLPASDVELTDQGQTIADVVVILGADFKP